MADRNFFIGGNFKMNGDKGSLDTIIDNLNKVNSTATGNCILMCVKWTIQ